MNGQFKQGTCKNLMLQIFNCLSEETHHSFENSLKRDRRQDMKKAKYEFMSKNVLQIPDIEPNALRANSLTSGDAHLYNTPPDTIQM